MSAVPQRQPSRMRRAAIRYAERYGWRTFALRMRKKDPAVTAWKEAATTDPEAIHAMWEGGALRNVAIVTGDASGIVVLDVDGPEGEASLHELEGKHGALPVTPTVQTQRGWHFYFQHPGGHVGNSLSKIGQGLDVKGDGGYVVGPPSVHPDGSRYGWLATRHPDHMPLALLPDWLLNLAAAKRAQGSASEPTGRADAYASAALERECRDVARAAEGWRNDRLNRAAYALGQLVAGGQLDEATVTHELRRAARAAGLPDEEASRTIQSGLSAGTKQPRTPPQTDTKGRDDGARKPRERGTPVVINMADVEPESVQWLWPGRIPLGKLAVLDGDPGLGKSLITLDLAARVTRGDAMPDGTGGDEEPGGVVLLSAEDELGDTIRPRLNAAGADERRVAAFQSVDEGDGVTRIPSLADLSQLKEVIEGARARLVVIDPVMAFIPGDTNSHRDQDIRRLLAPLQGLASETGAAILLVRHLNKTSGGPSLYRGGGSIGIVGAARAGMVVGRDPDGDEGRRILAPLKANLAAEAPALAYRIDGSQKAPRIEWEGPTKHSADQLVAERTGGDEESRDATEWLRELLAEGGMPCKEIRRRAQEEGYSWRTIQRVRAKAGVASCRSGFGGPVMWSLSIGATSAPSAPSSESGANGANGGADGNPGEETRT